MEDHTLHREAIAQLLVTLREQRGPWLTQGRLAELTGVDPSYISRMERGERAPSLDTLARLAPGYGLTPLELARLVFEAAPPPEPVPPADPLAALSAVLSAGPWTEAEARALGALVTAQLAARHELQDAYDRGVVQLLAAAREDLDELIVTQGPTQTGDWLAARLTDLRITLFGPNPAATECPPSDGTGPTRRSPRHIPH